MLRRFAIAIALLLAAACGGSSPQPPAAASTSTAPARLFDGVYAVVAQGTLADRDRFAAAGYTTRVYTDPYGVPPDPPRLVALDVASAVPLELETAPETAPDGRGHALLSVTLKRRHVAALRELTRAHLGGTIAIVVDGDVATMHKVRAVIDGGRMQITRCTDDGCTLLRSKLAQ